MKRKQTWRFPRIKGKLTKGDTNHYKRARRKIRRIVSF